MRLWLRLLPPASLCTRSLSVNMRADIYVFHLMLTKKKSNIVSTTSLLLLLLPLPAFFPCNYTVCTKGLWVTFLPPFDW